jgi:hypothetical protein
MSYSFHVSKRLKAKEINDDGFIFCIPLKTEVCSWVARGLVVCMSRECSLVCEGQASLLAYGN